jgi:magnesium-transporting ATPase (P-type)
MATEVRHISSMLAAEEPGKTPLTRQLDRLTHQILTIAGVALVVSMALNLRRGDSFDVVFAAAVAFAIGAIPENLPAVVTTILAYGTLALATAGAIMKRLQSTETLGSTSAINSDKTGTLTLNEMTAVRPSLVGRSYAVQGTGYSSEGGSSASPASRSSTLTSSSSRWCSPLTPWSPTDGSSETRPRARSWHSRPKVGSTPSPPVRRTHAWRSSRSTPRTS